MTVQESQRDLRLAYAGGGPGAFISSLVWFAAAWIERSQGVGPAFTVLFFGGMLIFPISALLCRLLLRRNKVEAGNGLGAVALESTVAMIGGLFAAWLVLPLKPEYVFPIAAIAVGTHYAAFRTVYGDRLFWALAALITAVGVADIYRVDIPGGPILAVGVIELVFAVILTVRSGRAAA